MPTTVTKELGRANSAVMRFIEDGSGDTLTLNEAFFASGFPDYPAGLVQAFREKATAAAANEILENLEWSVIQDNGPAAAVPLFALTAPANVPQVAIAFPASGGSQWLIKIKTPNSLTL